MKQSAFDVGLHRPVYLWAGPGTIRMNRLKFMGAPVDEAVHAEAHQETGARRMAEAGFTWAYLAYDWGFPPEVEQEDWDEFRRAVDIYHRAGLRVWGYVQTSNCVYDGSYRNKDWYALDPRGKPFHYYTGRYMTCWRHPEWRAHLEAMARGVVEAGADGVFFDNPWHGSQPLHLGGAWLGGAGCYCPRCRAAYRQATGADIPAHLAPDRDGASRRYLGWRAGEVTGTLSALAGYARSLRPDVAISVNDFDAVMRPSTLVYGIDLHALAGVQDVIMIEDYGLPRWQPDTGGDAPLLRNNALTLRTARALCGETPLSTNPYDKGIGFDGVYPPRRLQQGIAEAAACGASMVVKGTEYVEQGVFTLLSAAAFGAQRQAIGAIHRWLAAHAHLYRGRSNAAPVGLLYPAAGLWPAWDRLAPVWFAAGQALLAAGVPWRVVRTAEEASELQVVLCFENLPAGERLPAGVRLVSVANMPGWQPPTPSFLARHAGARRIVTAVVGRLFQAYFRSRAVRRAIDRLGLVHFFWQTPFFRLPRPEAQQALLAALGNLPYPQITAAAPVLVEVWQQGPVTQLHLVNYHAQAQVVRVEFPHSVRGRVLSPDGSGEGGEGSEASFDGSGLCVTLDVYAVVEYRSETVGRNQ